MKTNQSIPSAWIIAFGVLSSVSIVIMPMLVNVMKATFELSVAQAGQIASIELAGVAIATVLLTWLMSKTSLKTLATALLVSIVLGNVFTVLFPNYILVFRLMAGLGSGASLALMSARLATTEQPEKNFAYFFTSYLLTATVLFHTGGFISQLLGANGIYYLLIALAVISILIVQLFFNVQTNAQQSAKIQDEASSNTTPVKTDWRSITTALIAMLLFFIATGTIWVYMGQIGGSVGVVEDQVLATLGYATIAGAVGSLLSSFVAIKFGRKLPLIASFVILIGLMCAIMTIMNPANFSLIALSFVFVWMFSMPYLMGVVAMLDPQGRAASLGIGAQNGGQSIGPAVASLLIVNNNFTDVALMGLICLVLALVLCLKVLISKK